MRKVLGNFRKKRSDKKEEIRINIIVLLRKVLDGQKATVKAENFFLSKSSYWVNETRQKLDV